MNRPAHTASANPARVRQSGAALFIGLILLVIITLIGISGVRSVIMEKNMASNNQYQVMVFQAAETGIEGALADTNAFIAAINTPTDGTWPTRNYNVTHADNPYAITSVAEIQVGAPTVPVGYSIGEFVTYPFTIISDGTIASINAADRHTQTATKIAPYLN
jgi:hypothetical protein